MPSFSKKRIEEIRTILGNRITDQGIVNEVIQEICNILKYNPDKSVYTKELGHYQMAWRKKKSLKNEESIIID